MRADTLGFRVPLFDRTVYAARRQRVAAAAADAGLDALLVSVPEHIYWLVGLDHFGYFAFHMLVLPAEGDGVLIARRMEHVTITRDVPDLRFAGYDDDADLGRHCLDVLASVVDAPAVVGVEERSLYLPPIVARTITAGLPRSDFVDATDLIERMRFVQSPEELSVTRHAAGISDAMIAAAVEAAGPGVTERDVAGAAVAAMVDAGGEPPAFWPFVRATSRLNEDHTTWTDYPLQSGDALFLEMSGSIGRYHAPIGRVIYIDEPPTGSEAVATVCLAAFEAARTTAGAGSTAGAVYAAWQEVLDHAGFADYRRHHCGYATGIGFPPSWSGGGVPRALRAGSGAVLTDGAVFHLMSWMMGTGRGDYFVSDTVRITGSGAERLTSDAQDLRVV